MGEIKDINIKYEIITPSKIYKIEKDHITVYMISQEKIKEVLKEERDLEKTINEGLIILE